MIAEKRVRSAVSVFAIWGGILALVIFFVFSASIAHQFLAEKKGRLELTTDYRVESNPVAVVSAKMTWNGKPMREVHRLTYSLQNTGNAVIKANDFVGPLTVFSPPDFPILNVSATCKPSEAPTTWRLGINGQWFLSPMDLRPGESIEISVILASDIEAILKKRSLYTLLRWDGALVDSPLKDSTLRRASNSNPQLAPSPSKS